MKHLCLSLLTLSALLLPMSSLAAPLSPNNTFQDPTYDGNARDVTTLGTSEGQQDSFVNVVKGAVNWVLGVLALIALIFLIWGGFQMVTSGGDEDRYKAGFTILKHAAIGLMLIGVAWFIVSIIFWLINQVSSDAGPAGTES